MAGLSVHTYDDHISDVKIVDILGWPNIRVDIGKSVLWLEMGEARGLAARLAALVETEETKA